MPRAIGIMQGRLTNRPGPPAQVFPIATWRKEFAAAKDLGFDFIEWLFEADSTVSNPILSASGRRDIADAARETGVRVDSVCAHYFSQRCGFNADGLSALSELVSGASSAGVRRIVYPFMDASSFRSLPSPERRRVVRDIVDICRKGAIALCLETDVPAAELRALLEAVPGGTACVDAGNAVSLGFSPVDELSALTPLVGEIHVKDRTFAGEGRMLGKGDTPLADFLRIADEGLPEVPIVLETPATADARDAGQKNLRFVRSYLERTVSGR